MAKRTTNIALYVWDLRTDKWNHNELDGNWQAVDDNIWTGKNRIEILPAVPTSGNFAGRLVMLSAANGGFPGWGVIRFDGTTWKSVGAIEVQAFLPTSGNYDGRLVMVSQAVADTPAWTLYAWTGSAWREIPTIGIQEEGTLAGERRAVNFIDGAGIQVDIADNIAHNRLDVTFASTAESELTVRKNNVTIGTRKGIDFHESSNVEIEVDDDPDNSKIDLTFNADLGITSLNTTALLDYEELNPGSTVTKTATYVPTAAQAGTAAQSPLDHNNYFHGYGHNVNRTGNSLISHSPSIGSSLAGFSANLVQSPSGWTVQGYTPAQATTYQPLPRSSLWQEIDPTLALTFTVPDSGAVMIALGAVVTVAATSPRVISNVEKVWNSTGVSYTVQTQATPWTGAGGTSGTSTSATGLTHDQAVALVNNQQQTGTVPPTAGGPVNPNTASPQSIVQNPSPVPVITGAGTTPWVQATPQGSYTNQVTYESVYANLSDVQAQWCMKEGDFLVHGSEITADASASTGRGANTRTTTTCIIAGLTPGAVKTWKWCQRVYNPFERASASVSLLAGGDIGPAVMEVWSLP